MAAKDNLTKSSDIQSTARVIDFVTRFARNWEHLREILGIMRPIRNEPGAILRVRLLLLPFRAEPWERARKFLTLRPQSLRPPTKR